MIPHRENSFQPKSAITVHPRDGSQSPRPRRGISSASFTALVGWVLIWSFFFGPLVLAQDTWICGAPDPIDPQTAEAPEPILGEVRVLVVLVRFPVDPDDPFPLDNTLQGGDWTGGTFPIDTAELAASLVFDDRYPSPPLQVTVNDWVRENSFDRARLSGTVVGYHLLDDIDVFPRPGAAGAQFASWSQFEHAIAQRAVAAAVALDNLNIELDESGNLTGDFDRLVVGTPLLKPGAGGLVHGVPSQVAWVTVFAPKTIAHELGHTFGLHHAGAWDCWLQTFGGDPLCGAPPCRWEPRWDYFDPMGFGKGHINSTAQTGLKQTRSSVR
jgi:hypothetical protein